MTALAAPPLAYAPTTDPSGFAVFQEALRRCNGNHASAHALFEDQTGRGCPYWPPGQEPPTASIDFETRSEVDIGEQGAHVYAAHPSTRILCMAWAIEDTQPQLWLPSHDLFPSWLLRHLERGGRLRAWNAEFEQLIWQHIGIPQHGFPPVPEHLWRDAMAQAAASAMPQRLGRAGAALGLAADKQKDQAGALLIRQLCVPRKPTASNPSRWNDDPERHAALHAYCLQDVVAERAIAAQLPPLSPSEQRLWHVHSRINHRGIAADRVGCTSALRMIALAEADYRRQVTDATGGLLAGDDDAEGGDGSHDVGSHAKLRQWLQSRGCPLPSVDKAHVDAALAGELPADVRIVLTARRALGRSSTKKFRAMLDRVSADGRIRGSLRFHGAHTGRWTGAGIQPQNLLKGDFTPAEVDACLVDMATLDLATFSALWGDPLTAAGWCLRGCLWAAPGHTLIAADYTGIEARVTLWLAGDAGAAALARGVDLYREMAAMIYGILPGEVTKAQRQLGKIAILGLGYGMGAEKFVATCAAWGITIDAELAERTVQLYRERFAAVKAIWYALENAAVTAVRVPGTTTSVRDGAVRFKLCKDRHLRCQLPSRRMLTYPFAQVGPRMTPWGEERDAVSYMAEDQGTHQWRREDTYGGKLLENVVQAISRDLMADAIVRCEADPEPFPVVLTVHDEVIAEVPEARGTDAEVARFVQLLTTLPPWAAGCPIAAEGWHGRRYRK